MKDHTELSEVRKFARENGYVLAMYTKNDDGSFDLTDIEDPEEIADSVVVEYEVVGKYSKSKDFSKVKTADGKFIFILHNTYNIMKKLPIFS
jgi:hypothetical protein